MLTDDACYRALSSRDARFDGWFFVGVLTTGIYCRPSCPAMTPKRANVRFLPTAAAAHEAGFRACKRCRPDAAPGSPEWNVRADLVGRAMRHIADGVVDREGVAGLARRLGYSERQVHRQLAAEVGAGPIALARAQRSQTARLLLETTPLPITEVAFAAGFASVRQFNDTVRAVFALTPSELRARSKVQGGADKNAHSSGTGRTPTPGALNLRLPFRRPFEPSFIFDFLARRAIAGVEAGDAWSYRRTIGLAHGAGLIELGTAAGPTHLGERDQPSLVQEWVEQGWIPCRLRLADLRDLASAVARCRRLLDLDADAVAIVDALGADPVIGATVQAEPGRRVPGHVDGFELAVRAVLGQQISVAGARALAGRLVTTLGASADGISAGASSGADPAEADSASVTDEVTRLFPTAESIAAADPLTLPLTRARAAALVGLAQAVVDGSVDLEPGADRDATGANLLALPGVGPWTVNYIRMRALGDPDVFMPTDLGVRRGLEALGADGNAVTAEALSRRWRPWRSYALQHVWAATGAPNLDTQLDTRLHTQLDSHLSREQSA
jgi:AraC family transcriptional regulator of adaptative response / DNA-3-methyladenine glycosylase II